MASTIIKQLQLPDGSTYQFDAVKFGGNVPEYYATKEDLQGLAVTVKGGLIFRGSDFPEVQIEGVSYRVTPAGALTGDVYVVASKQTVNNVSCESGDMWICKKDSSLKPETVAQMATITEEYWTIVQGNIDIAALSAQFASSTHTHSLNITSQSAEPDVTVDGSKFTFGGSEAHDHNFTVPAHDHTFTGSAATLTTSLSGTPFNSTGSYTPEGKVKVTPNGTIQVGDTGTAYTPGGTVESSGSHSHDVTVSGEVVDTVSVLDDGDHSHSVSASGTYTPDGEVTGGNHVITQPKTSFLTEATLIGTLNSDTLVLSMTASTSDAVTSVTITDHQLTFTGTQATIDVNGTATTAGSHNHGTTTTKATVTLTGTAATVTGHTHEFKGTQIKLGFVGTETEHNLIGTAATITVSGTPTGSVTFNYTPAGTVQEKSAVTATTSTATVTISGNVGGTATFKTAPHTHVVSGSTGQKN